MKKLVFTLSAVLMLLLTSCAVHYPSPGYMVFNFDYSEVSKAYGVGFTESDAVHFDYDALGTMTVIEYGGYVKKEEAKKIKQPDKFEEKDGVYYQADKPKTGKMKYVEPSPYQGLADLAEAAKEIGGDYVINLSIKFKPRPDTRIESVGECMLSGMVVKRK